jgi:beta-galactosidase
MASTRSLLYRNGGPVIMVQIENEYGAYPACDQEYLRHLVHLMHLHLGQDSVLLFATDGCRVKDLNCSFVDGVYSTVDFGTGVEPEVAFAAMRAFEPRGPLVNSEFYTGGCHGQADHVKK